MTWRNYLEQIKAAKKEYREYYGMMTEYERATAQKRINELKHQYNHFITKGVLEEHERALMKLKRADDWVKGEKKRETASWDASRLASEMQVYNMLIDQAMHTDGDIRENAADRLENLYNEAKESGDKYKYRAAAEVMKSAVTKAKHLDTDGRKKVNHLAQQSKRDMQEIRSTPGMAKAYESAEEAWTEYRAARQDVIRTANAIDAGDPMHPLATNEFSKQIKRVQVIVNEIKIFESEKA